MNRPDQLGIIGRIADRASTLFGVEKFQILMDLDKVDCEIDFHALLAADDANFAHDIAGIHRHLNHATGYLMDCFVPRYAK